MARTATRARGEFAGRRSPPATRSCASVRLSPTSTTRKFPDPDRFDIGRSPNEHLAFGGGGHHFCLGASLARLELRALFSELTRRFEAFTLDAEPTRMRNSFANAITAMPVAFTSRA